MRVAFNQLRNADFVVDAIYEGGAISNLSSEVLSKLMHVGNSGGFRKCNKVSDGKKVNDIAYVCIYSTGEELEWRDEFDRTLGRFTYWGDNRTAGSLICDTRHGGNVFLQEIFNNTAIGLRSKVPPVFVFQKAVGRDVIFLGLAVPGDRRIRPQDALVAVWAQNDGGRYQNYKAIFTVLDIPFIDRRWLNDLELGNGYESEYAPQAWKNWIKSGVYKPLITEKNPIQYRRRNEQIPDLGSTEYKMLQEIIDFFENPYDFEQCACKIVQMMDSNVIDLINTKQSRDGGRDAIGKYRVGSIVNGIELEFAMEAKRYNITNFVGVRETSRLISRIRNRQFGIFVTTSYIGDQAYKEIIEDQHPIIIVAGKDIIEILMNAGVGSIELLKEWLDVNFGK